MIYKIQLLFLFSFLTQTTLFAQNLIQQQSNESNVYMFNNVAVNQNQINSPNIRIDNVQPVIQTRGNRGNYNPTIQVQTQLSNNIQLPNPEAINLNIELNAKEKDKNIRTGLNKPSISMPELTRTINERSSSSEISSNNNKTKFRNNLHLEKFWFKKKITRPIKRFFIRNFSKQKKLKIKLTCSF